MRREGEHFRGEAHELDVLEGPSVIKCERKRKEGGITNIVLVPLNHEEKVLNVACSKCLHPFHSMFLYRIDSIGQEKRGELRSPP